MPKVTHDVSTFKDTFHKIVLVSQVAHVAFFGGAKIFIDIISDELILKAMDCPSDMSWQSTIDSSI
jgi:hypothetical protein